MRTRKDVIENYKILKKLRKCDLIALIEELRDSVWVQGDNQSKKNPADKKNRDSYVMFRILIERNIPWMIREYLNDEYRHIGKTNYEGRTIDDIDLNKEAFSFDDSLSSILKKVKK